MSSASTTATSGQSSAAAGSGPVPPPASTLPASTPLVAPMQSAAAAIVEASVGGPTISSLKAELIAFPLTQTAVAGNFGGDAVDTARSKSLYTNLDGPFMTYVGGGWNLAATVAPLADLDWTTYGYWDPFQYGGLPHTSRGAWVTGFQTPLSAIPASGSARYAGKVLGLHSDAAGRISGDVSLQADFGARTLSGAMTNLTVKVDGLTVGAMNDVSFSATLASGLNQFAGKTVAGPAPAGPAALSAGASGDITGHFFGPGGQEVGAVWTLSDGQKRAIGSFGARQN